MIVSHLTYYIQTMKKNYFVLIVFAVLLVACGNSGKQTANGSDEPVFSKKSDDGQTAQNEMEIADIVKQWQGKTITLKTPEKEPGIEKLAEAFNRQWPTLASSGEKKVDAANGYMTSFVEGQIQEACFWKLANGHRLFAVSFDQPDEPVISAVLFYDYDPAKGTLTPTKNGVLDFKPIFEGSMHSFKLPQKGKDIIVDEYIPGWDKAIYHIYKFDGKTHNLAGSRIQDYDQMFKKYKEYDDMYKSEDATFAKFALVDIDEDGNPELWFRSAKGGDGAFFAINGGNVSLLITENYHSVLAFYKGAIQQSGGCGTGCHMAEFVTLKDSQFGSRVRWFTQYSMDGEDVVEEEYTKDEKPMTKAEGEKFVKSLGKDIDPNPVWHPLLAD